jgi:hypothetical protein
MNFWHRKAFLIIALLVFLILAPILIVLSLGFDTNLNRTLTTKIENYPRGGQIFVDGQLVTTAPGEIISIAGKKIVVEVKQTGFLDEKFTFWSNQDENSTSLVNNLWLLPSSPFETEAFNQNFEPLAFLAENLILMRSVNTKSSEQQTSPPQLFLQRYNANGLDGDLIPIEKAEFEPTAGFFNLFGQTLLKQVEQLTQSGSSSSQSQATQSTQSNQLTSSKTSKPTIFEKLTETQSSQSNSQQSSIPTKTQEELNLEIKQEQDQQYNQTIDQLNLDNLWQDLEYDAFWQEQNQLLIYLHNSQWQALNFNFSDEKFVSVARISNSQLVFLRQDSSLWLLDIESGNFDFIDNGYLGLSFTTAPENIWLWKKDSIYRLNRGQLILETFQPTLYFQNPILNPSQNLEDTKINQISLKVRTLYQGLAVKFADKVLYLPDINRDRWLFLANNVLDISTDSNNLFWVDADGYLQTTNLFLNTRIIFGLLPENVYKNRPFSIFFSNDWSRLMIYSENSIYSAWISKDATNFSLKSYNLQPWLTDNFTSCFNRINNSRQFCINQSKQLEIYKNTRIF